MGTTRDTIAARERGLRRHAAAAVAARDELAAARSRFTAATVQREVADRVAAHEFDRLRSLTGSADAAAAMAGIGADEAARLLTLRGGG